MTTNQEYIYSIETIDSIVANPNNNWKTQFKETIISMIASNKNELLWYSNFLSRCEYEFHFNESFVSSVYFNGKNFVISINPLILGVTPKEQIIAILKHNAGHIINHHFSRLNKDTTIDKEIIETAKDIVINGNKEVPYIKDLPQTGEYKNSPINSLFYQTLTEQYGIEDYEIGREFEYYVELIIKALEEDSEEEPQEDDQSCNNNMEEDSQDDETEIESDLQDHEDEEETNTEDELNIESNSEEASNENNESSGNDQESNSQDEQNEEINLESTSLTERTIEALNNGNISIDNHEFGEHLQEAVGLDPNLLESFMDTTLNELINDSTNFARGFTPGEAIEALTRIEKRKSHKDWKKILNKKMRNFLTNSIRYRDPNKSRQHPIYPDDLDLYGYSPGKKPKVAVVLDVSGSVEDKLLSNLMSEIQAIQKKYSIKNVTLVQVDAQIKSIEKFGVHDKFIVRHGSGGTIMEPGFSALLKQPSRNVPDIIICATDGDIEERFEHLKLPHNIQIIWLINENAKLRFDTSIYPKQQMHVIKFLP